MLQFVKNTDTQEAILECHKALGNVHRLSMLSIIASANRNEIFINANILSESIDMEQGLCSHHLSILKNAGLLRWESISMDGARHKALYVNNESLSHLIRSLQNIQGERQRS